MTRRKTQATKVGSVTPKSIRTPLSPSLGPRSTAEIRQQEIEGREREAEMRRQELEVKLALEELAKRNAEAEASKAMKKRIADERRETKRLDTSIRRTELEKARREKAIAVEEDSPARRTDNVEMEDISPLRSRDTMNLKSGEKTTEVQETNEEVMRTASVEMVDISEEVGEESSSSLSPVEEIDLFRIDEFPVELPPVVLEQLAGLDTDPSFERAVKEMVVVDGHKSPGIPLCRLHTMEYIREI